MNRVNVTNFNLTIDYNCLSARGLDEAEFDNYIQQIQETIYK